MSAIGDDIIKKSVTAQVVRFTVHGWLACALQISLDSQCQESTV